VSKGVIGRSYIVGYKEEASALERSLREDNLNLEILRGSYTEVAIENTHTTFARS
jgi:hypothetical protein